MDPVTVTGLIVSVSQLFEYTGKIVKYVNNVRNAPAERNEITKECVSLLGQLNDLKSRAETTDPTDAWFDGVRKLACGDGPLEQFKESLEKLAKALKPAKGAKKYGKMILWPLSKQDTQTALSHIHRLQTLIAAALTQDHFNLSLAIKDKLDDISSANTDIKRQQVLDWISQITSASKQQDHLRRRQEGTGTWFLNEPLFQGWLLGHPSVLWCPGIPAAGKTILA
ncbi:hypothetical protein BFW01_g11737 [Lasiodiplodia theobromae]|nr:hypothetical protein BFW01_g11737 [Lasiodiplodia theobromae]